MEHHLSFFFYFYILEEHYLINRLTAYGFQEIHMKDKDLVNCCVIVSLTKKLWGSVHCCDGLWVPKDRSCDPKPLPDSTNDYKIVRLSWEEAKDRTGHHRLLPLPFLSPASKPNQEMSLEAVEERRGRVRIYYWLPRPSLSCALIRDSIANRGKGKGKDSQDDTWLHLIRSAQQRFLTWPVTSIVSLLVAAQEMMCVDGRG